jgi:ABC-type transport system substrate-binding protein
VKQRLSIPSQCGRSAAGRKKPAGKCGFPLFVRTILLLVSAAWLSGCGESAWNNPYSEQESGGNILYSSFSERPKHMDPARSYSSNEYAFIAQIYEPPLQYHFLKRPYTLEPLTTDGMPEVSYLDADGNPLPEDAGSDEIAFSEYLFHIRPGIRFQPHPLFVRDEQGNYPYHDLSPAALEKIHTLADFDRTGSRELTAADYIYQIKRLAFPRFHCPISGVMAEYIVGFQEYATALSAEDKRLQMETARDRPYLDLREHDLPGVQPVDRYSYRIRLKGKYPQFLYWMAMPFFAPMPWEADRFYAQEGLRKRNIKLDWYPVGTGPFMLAENNPNLRMVLARNPNFHGELYPQEGEEDDRNGRLLEDAGKALPLIDKAVYSLEKETIPYWNKFLQGYYDTSGISSDSFDQAVQFDAQGDAALTDEMAGKGIQLTTAVQTSIGYFGFNMRDPVVGGDSERARLLRRAISIAADYEEFISIFANGRGIAAQGPIAPGIFGLKEGDYNRYVYQRRDGKLQRRPIAEAKQLLAQAGYPEGRDEKSGEPLVLYYDVTASGPDDKARLNWWRKQFTKLGIQLVIRSTDYNRFQEKTRKGTAQMFSWGWNADYPDPENFLFLLYGPNAKVDGEGENASNYANPEFDALFVRMKNMENSPERQRIIDEMMEILRRDAPWIWGYHPKAFSLHHAWYHNVKPNLMANNTLKYKRVEPVARERLRKAWNPPVLWPLITLLLVLLVTVIPAVQVYRRHERSAAR